MAKRSLIFLGILLVLGLFAVSKVAASEEVVLSPEDDEVIADPFANDASEVADAEFVEDVEAPSQDITHVYHILNHSDKRFPAGETMDFLIGINNPGEPIIISGVQGFLASPDFAQSYVNFTAFQYQTEVQAQTEASIFYRMRTVPDMETRSFGLIIVVAFTTASVPDTPYQLIVFKDVIEITDPITTFDAQTGLTYLALLGIAGAIGFFVYTSSAPSKKSRPLKPEVERGTENKELDMDWLVGTNALPATKSVKSKK